MLHKSQIFFWLLVSFLAGIFVASIFNISQVFVYAGLIAAVGLVGVFGYDKSFNGKLLLVGFFGIAFLFGVIRFNSANFGQDRLGAFTDLKAGQENIEVVVHGYIDGETIVKGNKTEMILMAKELTAGDKVVKVDDRIMITTGSFPRFDYGEIISAKGVLQKPHNLGEFDYVTYLKKENIRATMFYPEILGPKEYYDTSKYHNMGFFEKTKVGLYRKIFFLKDRFENAVSRSVSEPNASFVNGILLGSRQNVPDDLKAAFNKTGTTHILAISGYNIMIISWAVLAGLTVFFRRRVAFWVSVAVICFFVVLTGASASVVRAAIMGLLLLFAHGYGRLYDPKNSIILAGAAMAYLNPLVLSFDIGFQLSFAAVLGLMYLYPRIDNRLHKVPKLGILKETFLMTLSAQIAVAPLLIYYFRGLSFISLPANVLVVPFLPASMFLGFVAGLAGMVLPVAGEVFGWFVWAITTYQIWVVKFLA